MLRGRIRLRRLWYTDADERRESVHANHRLSDGTAFDLPQYTVTYRLARERGPGLQVAPQATHRGAVSLRGAS